MRAKKTLQVKEKSRFETEKMFVSGEDSILGQEMGRGKCSPVPPSLKEFNPKPETLESYQCFGEIAVTEIHTF